MNFQWHIHVMAIGAWQRCCAGKDGAWANDTFSGYDEWKGCVCRPRDES